MDSDASGGRATQSIAGATVLRERRRGHRAVAVIIGSAAAVLAGVWGVRMSGYEPRPSEQALDPTDATLAAGVRYRVVPDVEIEPPPARLLERRLAALAAELERRTRLELARLELDIEGLAAAIDAILATIEQGAAVSVHVRDVESGHVLFDAYGDLMLIPASNQKLVTAQAVLDLLGWDYTFATRVLHGGNDLYLVGEGDPTLQLDDLRGLAVETAEKVDLAAVHRLVVDDTAFTEERLGPGYDRGGPGYAYEAPSGAVSLGYNAIEVIVEPVRGASKPRVTTIPTTSYVRVVNRARVGRRSTLTVTSTGTTKETVVEVGGTIPRKSRPVSVRRRIADPALFAGTVFAELLAEASTSQRLPVERGEAPGDADELVARESPPLVEILDAQLTWSNNFMSEQILRTAAWRLTGAPGDWEGGQEVVGGYWSAVGGDPDALVVENASGLGHGGRISATALVDLLAMAGRASESHAGLLDALPVAGESGTLRTRLRLSGKRVRAKTGTLNDVSALSGVITKEDGTPEIAFSILINASDPERTPAAVRRRIEDEIVTVVLAKLDEAHVRRAELLEP